jgi:hypothetical protein
MINEYTRKRANVHVLAGCDLMMPTHRKAFTEAVDELTQALVVGILNDLDDAKNKARTNTEENELISEVMDGLMKEHAVVWVRGEGYQPKPKGE